MREAASGDADFAVRLYKGLSATDGNVFLSPVSVRASLAMVYGGARGATATELAHVIGLGAEPERAEQALGDVVRDEDIKSDGVRLTIANGAWMQRGRPIQPAYASHLRDAFAAPLEAVDFYAAPALARDRINASVARATEQRIPALLARDAPLDSLRPLKLVLTNAVYFKAPWVRQFSVIATTDEPFTVSPATKVVAKTMHRRVRCAYAADDRVTTVELSYAGDRLRMGIVLPAAGVDLATVELSLDGDSIRKWTDAAKDIDVDLALPHFKITRRFSLKEPLMRLGATTSFDARTADFSGIDGARDLHVDDVIHQAFIAVDENGTEAAAATAIEVAPAPSLPPPAIGVRVDHPFLFYIRDTTTGVLLFMGRVVDPTVE